MVNTNVEIVRVVEDGIDEEEVAQLDLAQWKQKGLAQSCKHVPRTR